MHDRASAPRSGSPTDEERLQGISMSASIGTLPQQAIGLYKLADLPLCLSSELPLTGGALRNDGTLDQLLSSTRSIPTNEVPLQHILKSYSIGALQQQVPCMSSPIGSGLPSTGDLLHDAGSLVRNNLNGFGEQSVDLLNNQMAVERLRSTLSASMELLVPSSPLPLFSANQRYASAERDVLVSLTNADPQFNSVPDDPVFWIRLAAASLMSTALNNSV